MKVIYPDQPRPLYGAPEPTHTALLTFYRDELIYDIENYAFVEGDIAPADNAHQSHQVFDIAQDGNVDRVNRVLNLAVSEITEQLYPYAKEEINGDTLAYDDKASAPDSYAITLKLPSDFAANTVQLITRMIHEYLVYRVLQDWLSITYPDASAKWLDKIEMLVTKIRTALLSRTKTMRRKMKPF